MMFRHVPQQLLVFIISVMLIMKYCSATFGRLVPTIILQPRNRLIAHYDAVTFRAKFRFQKQHIKAVMLGIDTDAATDIICKNRSKCNSEDHF